MNRTDYDSRKTVLIGDTSLERFALFEKILLEEFGLKAQRLPNYQALKSKIEEARNWALVIFADDLPLSVNLRNSAPRIYSDELTAKLLMLICVYGKENAPRVATSIRTLRVPRIPLPGISQQITSVLETFARQLPKVNLPKLNWDKNDRTLREQIRSLSKDRNLEDGQKALQHLVQGFFDCPEASIERLGQGLSGAKVFLLRVEDRGQAKSFVLKLAAEDSLWKLEEEAGKHQQAMKQMGPKRFQVHLPSLQPRWSNKSEFIARYGNWAAVCYDYLGDDNRQGGIIDLETLLICTLEDLSQKTENTEFNNVHLSPGQSPSQIRMKVFDKFLDWLSREWYRKHDKPNQGPRVMWATKDCEPKKYPVVPPYQLKGKEKGAALGFLDSKDARKVAPLIADWEDRRKQVWEFLEQDGPTNIAALDNLMLATLSPAHGDLNSNNAIFWLHYADHPFLIDFPSFQEEGHALQDFARLEIEIIYALMDCQEENASKLKAGDHTHTQFDLWLRLINQLINGKDCAWQEDEISENIQHCLDLIQLLRLKAAAVRVPQGQIAIADPAAPAATDFLAEYLPALLYYTLREIGYSSRPIFKRLLAVYSASQILLRLENLSSKQI